MTLSLPGLTPPFSVTSPFKLSVYPSPSTNGVVFSTQHRSAALKTKKEKVHKHVYFLLLSAIVGPSLTLSFAHESTYVSSSRRPGIRRRVNSSSWGFASASFTKKSLLQVPSRWAPAFLSFEKLIIHRGLYPTLRSESLSFILAFFVLRIRVNRTCMSVGEEDECASSRILFHSLSSVRQSVRNLQCLCSFSQHDQDERIQMPRQSNINIPSTSPIVLLNSCTDRS